SAGGGQLWSPKPMRAEVTTTRLDVTRPIGRDHPSRSSVEEPPMILPARPLRLRSGHFASAYLKASLLALAGAAIAALILWWQGGAVRRTLHDGALWKTGVVADGGYVKGRETSHDFIVNSYDLDVEYTDQDGRAHHEKLEFETLFGSA